MARYISRISIATIIIAIIVVGIATYAIMSTQRSPAIQVTSPVATSAATSAPITIATQTATLATQASIVSKKDTLRIAVGGDLETVDSFSIVTVVPAINVLRHVHESLLWFDDKGNVIPWLAERWESSPDGLVWTFYLRKGVKFHDGSEFNATVVKANFDRWFDPTVRVPYRSYVGPVREVEVVDKYTIRIYLKDRYALFLKYLAIWPLFTSLNIIKKFGNATITEVVGTGPYKFVSWEKGKKIVLERFDEYWGPKPPIKRIEWLIIPDASTRLAALLAGDADFAYSLPAADLERVKNDPRLVAITPVSNRIVFIAILPKGPLADPRVRQAFNYAVDKEAIVNNILYGLGIPTNAPIPPHFFGYVEMKPYTYDPQKARRMLEEAGFPFDKELVLLHPTGVLLQDKQVAEAVQAYLSKVGVKVRLITMDSASIVAQTLKPLNQTDYDLILQSWGPSVPDAHTTLYLQFHSSQNPPNGLSYAHYRNPEVDALLEQAMKELNETKRADLYRKAIEIIWNDAPWIFLYTLKIFHGASKDLKGYWVYIDGERIYFYNAYFG